jgi:uncharacterized membrane protein SirB2
MIDLLMDAHSGWRMLVVAATILMILFFLVALLTRSTSASQETLFLRVWPVLIDIQVTLGLLVFIARVVDGEDPQRVWFEHAVLGFVIAFVAHAPAMMRRRGSNAQNRRVMGLVVPIIVMVLIYVSVRLVLERGLFEMTT